METLWQFAVISMVVTVVDAITFNATHDLVQKAYGPNPRLNLYLTVGCVTPIWNLFQFGWTLVHAWDAYIEGRRNPYE